MLTWGRKPTLLAGSAVALPLDEPWSLLMMAVNKKY